MTDEEIVATFKAHGVLRIPSRSMSDPDGIGFMVAIGRSCMAAERERCRAACLSVNGDAEEAANSSDVTLFDSDSYIAGYQDAAIDCDEAIRQEQQ